jgi:hypothetical protein
MGVGQLPYHLPASATGVYIQTWTTWGWITTTGTRCRWVSVLLALHRRGCHGVARDYRHQLVGQARDDGRSGHPPPRFGSLRAVASTELPLGAPPRALDSRWMDSQAFRIRQGAPGHPLGAVTLFLPRSAAIAHRILPRGPWPVRRPMTPRSLVTRSTKREEGGRLSRPPSSFLTVCAYFW